MNLPSLRRTAAHVAAAAVFETFPQVKLIGGAATSTGFFYDFRFPHLIHPELHFQIEEKMRQIVREKREIRNLEMVPFSAREFLKSRGHFLRCEALEGEKGLVPVVQMGEFVDLGLDGPDAPNSASVAAFKLFPCQNLGEGELRVWGTVQPSKEELKSFLKRWNEYGRKRHEVVGEERGFWREVEGEWVWLAPGLAKRAELVALFKKNLGNEALEILTPTASSPVVYKALLKEAPILIEVREEIPSFWGEEGLFSLEGGTELKIVTTPDRATSSLQSIEKTFNILTFRYSLSLGGDGGKGSRSWEVEDLLGRSWSAALFKTKELVEISIPIERNLALLLELCS